MEKFNPTSQTLLSDIIDEGPFTQQFFITPSRVVTSFPYDPGYVPDYVGKKFISNSNNVKSFQQEDSKPLASRQGFLESFKQWFEGSLLDKFIKWLGTKLRRDNRSKKDTDIGIKSQCGSHVNDTSVDLGVSSSSFLPDASRRASGKKDGVEVKNQSCHRGGCRLTLI